MSFRKGPTTPNLKLSKEKVFENNLQQLFTKGFLTVLTVTDAVLKEVRDCFLNGDEQRCKDVNPYLHSFWRNLHVRSGCVCVCVDERLAIPNSIQDAVLESLHLTHPGSCKVTLGQHAFWPHMHRKIFKKVAMCKPCTEIGKNSKPIIPASKWHPCVSCSEPTEEIQMDFGGQITSKKDQEIHFRSCIDLFFQISNCRSIWQTNGPNVVKILDECIQIHEVPRILH